MEDNISPTCDTDGIHKHDVVPISVNEPFAVQGCSELDSIADITGRYPELQMYVPRPLELLWSNKFEMVALHANYFVMLDRHV